MELTSKNVMASAARSLAQSYQLVQHGSDTFMPSHWLTEEAGPTVPTEQIWVPLSRKDKRKLGNSSNILFASESEITSFDIMLRQFAIEDDTPVTKLLIRTEDGLRVLNSEGELEIPSGQFLPNTLKPVLNTDPDDKAAVFEVIKGWLNSEEDVHSLLYHLSTALSPGWSAVKYVLFIGDGRNGKSLLLSMISDVFGLSNISNVTRQQIAERLPVVAELNSKLLNIVFDGEMTYLKDSSVEKTLTAGEPAVVRMLYENANTVVQTNALFIEALNKEPKTRDKSGALQKRLSRFWFQNVYALDRAFEEKMRSPKMIGAFLSLLIDHFVKGNEVAQLLKQTSKAMALQVEQNLLNSPLHQFVSHLVGADASYIDKLRDGPMMLDALADSFMAWRLQEGFNEYSTEDSRRLFKESFYTDWKSFREGGKVVRKQRVVGAKPDVVALLEQLEGAEEDEVAEAAVVED